MKIQLKNVCFIILLGIISLTSCENQDESEILIIASVRPEPLLPGFEIVPTYWVKFQGDVQWTRILEYIEGFNHITGHEYIIEVKKEKTPGYDPRTVADTNPYYYVLLRIISEEKKESGGIPEVGKN